MMGRKKYTKKRPKKYTTGRPGLLFSIYLLFLFSFILVKLLSRGIHLFSSMFCRRVLYLSGIPYRLNAVHVRVAPNGRYV